MKSMVNPRPTAEFPRSSAFRRVLLGFAAAAGIALAAALPSCSFDYGEASLSKDMAEEIPNAVLDAFEHSVVEKGNVIFRLQAKRAAIYETKKETRLTDVSFAEFDAETGEAMTSGHSSSAVFFSSTENAEFSGEIEFYSKRNKAGLNGGYLYWDGKKKTLEGRRDRLISISKDDGSLIKGEGFSADAVKRSFSFSGRTTGTMVVEDKDESGEEGAK